MPTYNIHVANALNDFDHFASVGDNRKNYELNAESIESAYAIAYAIFGADTKLVVRDLATIKLHVMKNGKRIPRDPTYMEANYSDVQIAQYLFDDAMHFAKLHASYMNTVRSFDADIAQHPSDYRPWIKTRQTKLIKMAKRALELHINLHAYWTNLVTKQF